MKIKNCILFISFLLPLISVAQNVKIKTHDVFVNDSPYCKIDGETNLKAALQKKIDFTIFSLSGKELIHVKNGMGNNFDVTFLEDGRKMIYKKSRMAFNIQKDFIKKMVNGRLLQADTINTSAKEAFRLKKDNTEEYDEVASSTANGIYNVTERNISEPVKIADGDITQDGISIGTYIIADEVNPNGTLKSVVTFYLPNETKVAKVDIENSNASNNDVVTFKDNTLDSIDELAGDFNNNKKANIKKAALWLIERGYL